MTLPSNPYVWAAIAGVFAVAAEAYFRSNLGRPWLHLAPVAAPLAIGVSYGIYKIMNTSPSLLFGMTIFPFATIMLRVVATLFVLREEVSFGTWCAVALLTLAQIVREVVR